MSSMQSGNSVIKGERIQTCLYSYQTEIKLDVQFPAGQRRVLQVAIKRQTMKL